MPPSNSMIGNHYTVAGAAAVLGVSRRRVNAMIEQGRLKAEKVCRVNWIKKSDLAQVKNRKPGRPRKRKI